MEKGLEILGYNSQLATYAQEGIIKGFCPARVTQELKQRYLVRTEKAEIPAVVAGRIMHKATSREDYPVVGDWVLVSLYDDQTHAVIHEILPRKTILQRKAPGKRLENQPIAANVDAVFIIFPLNQDWTTRAVERYLILVKQSDAIPYIFLSKKDLCADDRLHEIIQSLKPICSDIELYAYSLFNSNDIAHIASVIKSGTTFCLLGPSGAGKSSLINALVGKEILATGEVREYDAKGRHVTTSRQLIVLEKGGILIDTPGMREIGLWQMEEGLYETFDDIMNLSQECHFRDCTHTHEPGCAVCLALEEGRLSQERYNSFIQYQREINDIEKHLNPKELKELREQKKKKLKQEKNRILRQRKCKQ